MLMIVFKPLIKFFALGFGKTNRLWHCGNDVPNIFCELNAFSNAKFKDIGQGNFTHEPEA